MLPAEIAWPPNIFTPSLWPGESRPLREEPPAFLCAMILVLARRDAGDLHHGEVRTRAALAMGVLAALLLERDHLRSAAVLQNLNFDARAGNKRGARFRLVAAQHQDIGQRDLGANLAFELAKREHV